MSGIKIPKHLEPYFISQIKKHENIIAENILNYDVVKRSEMVIRLNKRRLNKLRRNKK